MDINQLDYTRAYISNLYRFIINKNKSATLPDMYYSNKILSQNNGSDYIEKLINSNEPFVTARFGSTELGCFHNYIKIKLGLKKSFKQQVVFGMSNNAGFFPTDYNTLLKFGELMEDVYPDIDLLAIFNIFMEDYITKCFCKNSALTVLRSVDPILSTWTKSLKIRRSWSYILSRNKFLHNTNIIGLCYLRIQINCLNLT